MSSTCSETTEPDEEDLLKYLVVIIPERATAEGTKAVSSENISSTDARPSLSANDVKPTAQSLQVSPMPAQKIPDSGPSGASSRVLAKHPGGDRHPNPDYQTRAKTQADLANEIRHGLEEYKKSVWRQRYSSYTRLGFEFSEIGGDMSSSRTSSFTDLSSCDDYYPVAKSNKVS